ncbi:MAG TPA: hypothetical protein VLH18_02320 [Candidatus Limnocylindrales bacterium]|nr:hypothetical protein [Candidatus Limnocylindrales bacterium]
MLKLDFVRGHMGGNLIIILQGSQLPPGQELETAIKVLGPHYMPAHEACIVYPAESPPVVMIKVAEPVSCCYISACGGATQVLGAALVETDLGVQFGVENKTAMTEVLLSTDCGLIPLKIETADGKAVRIKTCMDSFVRECYERGVGKRRYAGVEVMQSGKFLVVNADRFREVFPWADFKKWDKRTRDKLSEIQHEFQVDSGEMEYNVTLYDWNPASGGDARVVFPHSLKDNYIEPSCGTGTVALGIAVLACGELFPGSGNNNDKLVTLKIESGGTNELGGPDVTVLDLEIASGLVQSATFSHSRVEITAVGEVWV